MICWMLGPVLGCKGFGKAPCTFEIFRGILVISFLGFFFIIVLVDGSTLLAPGLSWAATGSTSVRLGIYSGLGGSGLEPTGSLASEYGSVPGLAYFSVSRFF